MQSIALKPFVVYLLPISSACHAEKALREDSKMSGTPIKRLYLEKIEAAGGIAWILDKVRGGASVADSPRNRSVILL